VGGSQKPDASGSKVEGGSDPPAPAPVERQRLPGSLPAHPTLVFVAVLFAAATIFFGIVPQPLFHFADHAGLALAALR
jgi:hypothetical protein